MTEFWESSFKDKQMMWGSDAVGCATKVAELFKSKGFKNILVPGFGYGRNAKIFVDKGMSVTGIEISHTAITIAKEQYGEDMVVHHGSVTNMPFDEQRYDGIFCYALIHLLNAEDRTKLLQDCYRQLHSGGSMVFVAISKNTPSYGQGTEVTKDTFLTPHGVTIFYYDKDSIEREFGGYNIVSIEEIQESNQLFWQIICEKD